MKDNYQHTSLFQNLNTLWTTDNQQQTAQNLLDALEKSFKYVCFLNSNSQIATNNANLKFPIFYHTLDWVMAFSNGEAEIDLPKNPSKYLFGYLSYDYKNQLYEPLFSNNTDDLGFDNACFFEPQLLLVCQNGRVGVAQNTTKITQKDLQDLIQTPDNNQKPLAETNIEIQAKTSKKQYLKTIQNIRNLIEKGTIYELNYCINFYSKIAINNKLKLFWKLNKKSPNPFAAYLKMDKKHVFCASPERFLRKKDNKLLSQPIKGTSKRDLLNELNDQNIKNTLQNNEKERAENVMIVDLVRNDLARSSQAGTVKVSDLFGIYTFPQVHQMISSIESEAKHGVSVLEMVQNAFPMGSMTGTPKMKSMEIIERLETTKRGIFSGSVGYVTPNNDFDFNVVIRSIFYDEASQHLSFSVGSAITYDSVGEQEYDECLLKAQAILEVLEAKIK